jgi:hypothetical protein
MDTARSSSSTSVAGPMTIFTQVASPASIATRRNLCCTSGATCSPSTLASFRSMLT